MNQYTYLNRVKVEVGKLKLGMYVGALDKPWEESPFLFQGFTIEDKQQLATIRRECRHVYVDFKDHHEYEIFLMAPELTEDNALEKNGDIEFTLELPKALKIYKETAKANKLLMRKVQQGQVVDFATVEHQVSECIESLQRNDRALLILLSIQSKIHYAAEHPVRVSILSLAFGLNLGMSREQLQLLGASAMLHDIGKLSVPEKTLNKMERLDKAEINQLRKHPLESYRILNQVEGISEAIKEVALSHHERQDGKGYPRHIPKDRVSRYAKIVSIIDAYDAIISERPYKKCQSPSQALKLLNKYKDSKFDGELVVAFIKWLGVMPVGALVEMASGEIGVVLKNRQDKKLKPQVMLVTDEKKKTAFERIVDLAKLDNQKDARSYQVKSVLPNHSFGINIEHYLNKQVFDVPAWMKNGEKVQFLHQP